MAGKGSKQKKPVVQMDELVEQTVNLASDIASESESLEEAMRAMRIALAQVKANIETFRASLNQPGPSDSPETGEESAEDEDVHQLVDLLEEQIALLHRDDLLELRNRLWGMLHSIDQVVMQSGGREREG